MASQNRSASPALMKTGDLLQDDASSFAFFQAMRLLRLRFPDEAAFRAGVRVKPALSLAFPETDIEDIHVDEEGCYSIEANFFGLYGVTSPLPTFYTEDLINEAMQGESSMRDFLDILHAALYPVLVKAWEKYRLWLSITEHGNTRRLDQLYALVGLQGVASRAGIAHTMLPYAGNVSWRPRSALGLQSLLSNVLGGVNVVVDPCVERAIAIPESSRSLLGQQSGVLGESTQLGEWVRDRAGNATITVGPLNAATFRGLMPGSAVYERVRQVVAHYLEAPLRCELHLRIDPRQRQGASLGQGWSRLGFDTWLGTRDNADAEDTYTPVRFPLSFSVARNFLPSHHSETYAGQAWRMRGQPFTERAFA